MASFPQKCLLLFAPWQFPDRLGVLYWLLKSIGQWLQNPFLDYGVLNSKKTRKQLKCVKKGIAANDNPTYKEVAPYEIRISRLQVCMCSKLKWLLTDTFPSLL